MDSWQWKRSEMPQSIKQLLRQREELRRERREMVKLLYETIAELEGRPVRQQSIGFPFNWLVRLVRSALNALEGWVRRGLAPLLFRQ